MTATLPNTIDQIISPKWLIPIDDDQSVLEDHSVAIDKGMIVAVGPTASVLDQYQALDRVVLTEHTLIPGMINAHTHAAMALLRGFADDLPLMQWLSEHIWPAESKWVDESFIRAGTDLAIAEMIQSGTTCFNDMYFYPDVVAERAESASIRACVGMIVIDFPTAWAQDADEYLSKGLAVRDQLRHTDLVTTAFAPHAPYTVSDEPLSRIATLSEELECPVHMHVHETAHEVEESVARFGMRPIERLDQLGLLTPNLMAVHMTQLLDAEIQTLAARGVSIVHCPESNLKLASGFCPIAKLDEAGMNIAIGTDGAASNNNLSMLGELNTAALIAKAQSGDPSAFNAHRALHAATLGGAKALGIDHKTGSIEVGKAADFAAIDLSDCSTQPVYHPVSQIVYSANEQQVSDVWVSGKALMRDRVLTTLDKKKILVDARQWGANIAAHR